MSHQQFCTSEYGNINVMNDGFQPKSKYEGKREGYTAQRMMESIPADRIISPSRMVPGELA